MLIYLVLLGLILSMTLLLYKNKINKLHFCIVIGLAFVLITGLRGPNVGSDTTVYYLDFKAMEYVSWSRLMSQEKRDVAFYVLSWVISRVTGQFVVLTMLVAVVFYYPIMKLIYKHSDAPGLSCLILMAFNFFQFSMTGMRQTLALGFVVMYFIELHEERLNWKKAVIFMWLAVLFHRSSLIALAYLPIRYIAKKGINVKPMVLLIPVMYVFRNTIITTFWDVFEEMGFNLLESDSAGAGLTTFLVYCLLTFGMLLVKPSEEEGEFRSNEIFLYAVLGTSCQALVMANSVFFRVAWYFALFFIILIPRFLSRGNVARTEMKIVRALAYCAVLFMYLVITKGSANAIPYEFFYQG